MPSLLAGVGQMSLLAKLLVGICVCDNTGFVCRRVGEAGAAAGGNTAQVHQAAYRA